MAVPNVCTVIKPEQSVPRDDRIMLNKFSRTQLLLGSDAMESLYKKKVAVFGLGGVGGHVYQLQDALHMSSGSAA